MKSRIVFACLALILAIPALGQATYQSSLSANDVAALTAELPTFNASVCAGMGLPSDCRQPAARNSFCVKAGLAKGCPYSAARDAWCNRFTSYKGAPCPGLPIVAIADTPEELFAAKKDAFLDALRSGQREVRAATFCDSWRAMTRAQQDTTCLTVPGQSAGCEACK